MLPKAVALFVGAERKRMTRAVCLLACSLAGFFCLLVGLPALACLFGWVLIAWSSGYLVAWLVGWGAWLCLFACLLVGLLLFLSLGRNVLWYDIACIFCFVNSKCSPLSPPTLQEQTSNYSGNFIPEPQTFRPDPPFEHGGGAGLWELQRKENPHQRSAIYSLLPSKEAKSAQNSVGFLLGQLLSPKKISSGDIPNSMCSF